MSFTHTRQELLKGIYFNTIVDTKFKSNEIAIKMFTKLDVNTASLNSLAISTIGSANNTYRTIATFNKRLGELYGSSIVSDVSKMGDTQILTLASRFIDDRFTFNGESITDSIVDMLIDCIFNPYVKDGAFNEELFNISKKELLDAIEGEINNKRAYAIIQSKKAIYRGEPACIPSYGDKEHAIKSTAKECYQAFIKLLASCNIEIFYVGCEEKSNIGERFKTSFASLKERNPEEFPITQASVIKSSVEELSECVEVNQAKMVLALKTTHDNKYNNAIMNTILGLSPFSKLFSNVREKLSLCYYCQSSYDSLKKTIFIDSGVELENIEKAKESILQQVTDIQNGNFSNEDVQNAIAYLTNALKSIGDTQSSYISWYFNNILIGEDRSIDGEYEKYRLVTKDDVILSAKTLTLDTIFVLKPIGKEV
ncbi:MAG: insulinase family protein [Ruminococcus sp.]|nr:insulinase family protein [Ruminococcus sp.]MCD7801029.1 insulinase family protein [Ruminococcus sp.]